MNHSSTDQKLHFKTIILSDLHLGSPYCQLEKMIEFLHGTTSDLLILNGDFIDGWSLARRGGWTHRCTRVIRILQQKIQQDGTRVIYIRGNHDDFLDKILPLSFEGLEIVDKLEYETRHGTYLIVHGDGFDSVTTDHKWMAIAGDIGYQLMMKSNRLYNLYCDRFQLPAFSISKWIKARVKSVVAFVDKYEEQLQELARKHQYKGIICGHIHTAADKQTDSFHYLNSGDWVESNTAIVEHYEGGFEVIDYPCFRSWKADAETRLRFRRKPGMRSIAAEDLDLDMEPAH
jgi:UDP-2,3-diacylglucosamine pyrophosphatase LpxH